MTFSFRDRAHAIETSQANHGRAPCRPHQIPQLGQLTVAAHNSHKKEALTQNGRYESLISVRARHHHRSCSSTARFWSPCPYPSLPAVPFLAEQDVSSSSSTTSRRSLEVGRKRDSSQVNTHDSILGRARVASLGAGVDLPLYRRRNLSTISCSRAHSSTASS
jgi:hypothetical protein